MMVMMVAGCRSCHEEDVHLFGCIAFLIETAALSEKINERSVAKLILLLHPCPSDADRNVQDTGHLRVIPSVSWSVLVVVVCASIVFPSCPIAMVNDERRRERAKEVVVVVMFLLIPRCTSADDRLRVRLVVLIESALAET